MNFLQLTSFANIHHGNENLDSIIEIQGLNGAFPSTFIITTRKRETIPSENKIYGDKHRKIIKQDGKIIREYGNATINELDQVYSPSNDNNDQAIICENRRSDFF
ncbi:unnamed protein product [Rotaria sp. Silwood1]|nr:unnamed protein product [Rotaria sp. Silwood1]CAF4982369.1 unnamed protein product [Rotaria sp. Silwood1]CAF5030294.1 unnamed protein product [Rotaria sp. Silwood1]CAF5042133.1 unnamed protein product [Rotaria sp. Silwood1]CAF5125672.1 unnamed protein product [Rotaria sp. Silwood1]